MVKSIRLNHQNLYCLMKTKKIIFLLAVVVASVSGQAQVSVSVNIGTPPVWAPAAPVTAEYYYLPDIEVYYDVPARTYIYFGNGAWRRSTYLPARYRGYNLAQGHTIYLTNYHGRTPYAYFKEHKVKYRGNNSWKANPTNHDNYRRKTISNHGRENGNHSQGRKENGGRKGRHND